MFLEVPDNDQTTRPENCPPNISSVTNNGSNLEQFEVRSTNDAS